jgi:GTPase involved in cell partitioning and DNA repair
MGKVIPTDGHEMRIFEILIESYDSTVIDYLNIEIKKWERKLRNFNDMVNANGIDAAIDDLKQDLKDAKSSDWYFNMFTTNQKVIQKREKVANLIQQVRSKIEYGI